MDYFKPDSGKWGVCMSRKWWILAGYSVLVLLLTYFVQHSVGAVRGYYLKNTGDKIVADLRNDAYKKAQLLPMRFYDSTSTGAIINRISGDSSTIQAFMLRVTQELLVQLFLLVGIVIIMFTMLNIIAFFIDNGILISTYQSAH